MKRKALPVLLLTLAAAGTFGTPLAAEESIDELLRSYRKEADLSKQTKKENAGFVVVYTRDDMERMQIFRLSDILRHLRFQPYRLNNFGMSDPVHVDPYFYNSDIIKLYVNDHEITTAFSGSGLQFYGDVDMGMFDHVEVYYHAPVLDIGTEPAAMLIKLYTKVPERENGGNLTARLGDRGTQELSLSHAAVFDEWSYFAYAEEGENRFRRDIHEVPLLGRSYEIGRDYSQHHLYLDLHKENHRVEMEYLRVDHDPYTAQTAWLTPTGGNWEQPMARIAYSGDFLEDALHLDASYVYSDLDFDITSDGPFWGQFLPDFNASLTYPPYGTNDFRMRVDGHLLTLKSFYEKEFLPKHLLKVGVEYRYKDASISDYRFNALSVPDKEAYMHFGAIYLQDQYQLMANSMLSASFKYNYYDLHRRTGEQKDQRLDTWQGRVAWSYLTEELYFKVFASHVEFPTQLYVLVLHDYELDSQKYDALSMEMKHLGEKDDFRLLLSYSWIADVFSMSPSVIDEVRRIDFRMSNVSFDYIHRFSPNHRLDFNLNWAKYEELDLPKDNFLAGYVRLLDTFGRIDLFNEVIYREETPYLDAGWDYSAGVTYRYNDDLKFSLKGVNLLGEAQEQLFLCPTPSDPEHTTTLPVVPKQFYFSVEWLF